MNIKLFYYILLSLSSIGFAASLYRVLHVCSKSFERKVLIVIEIMFIALMVLSVLGILTRHNVLIVRTTPTQERLRIGAGRDNI